METGGGHDRGLRSDDGGFIIEGELRTRENTSSSFCGGFGGGRITFAHFNIAVHIAVRMTVLASCYFQARFGAAFGKGGVPACH